VNRRAAALSVLAVIGILGGSLGWLVRPHQAPAAANEAKQTAAVSASAASTVVANAMTADAPTTFPTLVLPSDTSCGLAANLPSGRAKPSHADIEAAAKAARQQAIQGSLRAMLRSSDETAKAAGLALRASGMMDGVSVDASSCDGAGCWSAILERIEQLGRNKSDAGGDVLALAELARSTTSPNLYIVALQTCARATALTTEGACAALSWQRLTEMESDNAVPWLALAAQAQKAGDVSGLVNAMHRASLAQRVVGVDGFLTRQVLAHLPASVSPGLPRTELITTVRSVEIDLERPDTLMLSYCSEQGLTADGNRLNTCERLARLMLDKGKTMVDLSLGMALGRRTGLSQTLMAQAQHERDRMAQAFAAVQPMELGYQMTPTQCQQVSTFGHRIERMALEGERAVLLSIAKP
jgi:hypothetical protein